MCISDTPLILYTLPPSPNSGAVRTLLLAAEIPFEEKNVWGQTRSEEYITKFPSNLAPGLEHGDLTVSESVTIMRYLCRTFPDKAGKFYSAVDPKLAAKIDMLCDMINTTICPLIPKAIYPSLGFPTPPGDVASLDETKEHQAVAEKAATDALKAYLNDKIVAHFLTKTKFLLTDDTPTIADFRLATLLSQIKCALPMPERINEYLKVMNDQVTGYKEGVKGVDELHSQHWKQQEV